jgi:hypothetical protein
VSYQIYGQPLVVGNTVYVVTEGDVVYSFTLPANLTSQTCGNITYRATQLLPSGEHPVDCCDIGGKDCGIISPTVGILGTPAISTTTNTIYVET